MGTSSGRKNPVAVSGILEISRGFVHRMAEGGAKYGLPVGVLIYQYRCVRKG